MKETEVKILEIDRKTIERKLRSLGARKMSDKKMYFLCFDFNDGSLKKANNLLRLRKEGDKTILTFKGFVSDKNVRVREEIEVEVSDFKTARTILEMLGLSVWLEMRKRRIAYHLDGTHFEFDKYLGKHSYIPEFLEIEGKDAKTIRRYVKLLGFSSKDCKLWTAVKLIRHYSKR